MNNIQSIPWEIADKIVWKWLGEYAAERSSLTQLGLVFSIVDDDGLDYEVAAFLLRDGEICMVGRGVGGPESLWLLGVQSGSQLRREVLLDVLAFDSK